MLIEVFQMIPITNQNRCNFFSYPMKTGLMKHSCGKSKVTDQRQRAFVNC